MKLVSTSLFSEPYERDVLLIKLHNEYLCVDEFIFIESAYTTRNTYKGLFLQEVLSHSDFSPFRDKITILSNEQSFYPVGAIQHEQNNMLSEFAARAYCWNYIQNKYSDDTWVFLQDADESLNFSNPLCRDKLLDGFKNNSGGLEIFNFRYWWNFSNMAPSYEKYIPCHQVGWLKQLENPFHHRNQHCKRLHSDVVLGVEYCHCFTHDGNWRKVNSALHDKYQEQTLLNAYRYNTFHREPNRNEYLRMPIDFFEQIELDENNSPQFVLDNIDTLRVNTIDPDYAVHRVNELGLTHPHPCEQFGLMRGNKINRKYHYMRRK